VNWLQSPNFNGILMWNAMTFKYKITAGRASGPGNSH
jgi:hypothetical protein